MGMSEKLKFFSCFLLLQVNYTIPNYFFPVGEIFQ